MGKYSAKIKTEYRIGHLTNKQKVSFKEEDERSYFSSRPLSPLGTRYNTEAEAMKAIEDYAEEARKSCSWMSEDFVIMPIIVMSVNDLSND